MIRMLAVLSCWIVGWGNLTSVHAQDFDPAQSSAWLALLHFDGAQSRIDSPGFFLHPQGRFDPGLEWQATQERLRAEPNLRCVYPARFRFLQQQLREFAALSAPACPEFDQWRRQLNPDSATLVFASAYLGNPSSMFGHTFLRLDHGGSPLLSWVVNFAAQTQDPVSVSFALKGASGGYPGRFGFAPYYEKITEYVRLEQRDLWEYPLRLSSDELDRLLAHLWEMREVWFDYYFFQENCSFQLLALLQTVWPQWPLTEGFDLFAAPLDTVRRLQKFDRLEAPVWRPAAPSALRARIEALGVAERRWLRRSIDAKSIQMPIPEQPEVIEILSELAEYQMAHDKAQHWPELRRSALAYRSQMPELASAISLQGVSPDQSHLSQRIGVTWRHRSDDSQALLSWRPVLHDALDGPAGWPRGGEISVLDTRVSLSRGQLELDQLQVFSVSALPLRDQWFSPFSWGLSIGYQRDDFESRGFIRGEAAAGVTYGWSGFASLRHSYLLKAALLAGASGRRALETGLELKLQGQWASHWPWLMQLQVQRRDGRIEDAHRWRARLQLGQQWQIGQRWGLRAMSIHRLHPSADQFQLGLVHYF